MATAQKEIPIGDDELDDLMAQLEAETADVVDAPAASPAPAAAADDDLDALAAELNGDPDTKADDTPFEPVAATDKDAEMEAELARIAAELEQKKPTAAAAPVESNPDDELAALAAELEATPAQDAKPVTPPATPAAKPTALELAKAARAKVVSEEVQLAPASKPMPTTAATKPTPEPEPEPIVHLEGEEALAAVAASLEREGATLRVAPTPTPTPTPAAAAAAPKKELNHYIDMAEFRDDIKVSINTLDDAMMQQAGLRAYHGEQAAHAEAQHSRLKLRHEVVEARLYDKHRKALALTGEKVTEKMVENAVKQDPEYVSSKNRVIEAETIAAVRRSCTDALRDRKDMLVQLGADRREEGKGQLRILAAEGNHQDKRAAAAQVVGGLRSA
ncbi:hypothetical protein [Massilia sp. TN1-12]|uniref:hypothetical protein n=1 Tax=Massilia paldalensis TaxID=3377675 RepID=UPI00384B1B0B